MTLTKLLRRQKELKDLLSPEKLIFRSGSEGHLPDPLEYKKQQQHRIIDLQDSYNQSQWKSFWSSCRVDFLVWSAWWDRHVSTASKFCSPNFWTNRKQFCDILIWKKGMLKKIILTVVISALSVLAESSSVPASVPLKKINKNKECKFETRLLPSS